MFFFLNYTFVHIETIYLCVYTFLLCLNDPVLNLFIFILIFIITARTPLIFNLMSFLFFIFILNLDFSLQYALIDYTLVIGFFKIHPIVLYSVLSILITNLFRWIIILIRVKMMFFKKINSPSLCYENVNWFWIFYKKQL